MDDEPGRDFFISYTAANEAWAKWIAVELERAGYTIFVQAFDFRPGSDFVHGMQRATASAARTIAVLSPAYLGSRFAASEWYAAFAKDPTGEHGMLLPVRVQPVEPPGLLAARVFVDLVDQDEEEARKRLLTAAGPPERRETKGPYPGPVEKARFPGPVVSNLGVRNRNFTGRDEALTRLYDRLHEADVVSGLPLVEAVHGLGGVGKSALALEFAHRFAGDYESIWWVSAERPATATSDLARFAQALGIPAAGDQTTAIRLLFDRLRSSGRWLLIYDNAENPPDLEGLLPAAGVGHVLVTSRWSAWSTVADPLGLDVLDRAEAVRYLQRRTDSADTSRLGELAEAVGDLPLALAEIASYVEQTGIGLAEYLELLRGEARELFGLDGVDPIGMGSGEADRRRVATVWSVSLERIQVRAPAAESLMALCAFLAPVVPRTLPAQHPDVLPAPLAKVVASRVAYNSLLRVLGESSMVELDPTTLVVHRLVQAVVSARLVDSEQVWVEAAVALVRASFPPDSWEVASWPVCELLLPHVLAVAEHGKRLGVSGADRGWLLSRASIYQRERGQYRQALPLAEEALALTAEAADADHVDVAWRHDELGSVLRALGDLQAAREHQEQALRIGEAALDPANRDVGTWRNNLGLTLRDLGDLAGARNQLEAALRISEAALSPDHANIGVRRNNLGNVLYDLGDLAGARAQYEDALRISEAALDPAHPTIGVRRNNLGRALQALGDLQGARAEYEHALRISEAALGPDHPTIGAWRTNLAGALRALGDVAGARAEYEHALRISKAALGADQKQTRAARDALRDLDDR